MRTKSVLGALTSFNRLGVLFAAAILCLLPSAAVGAGDLPAGLHPILDPAFQQEMNATTHSVLSVGDDIELLMDGPRSYAERWRMLDEATEHVYITTMYVAPDEVTERFESELIRKKEEGLDVKLMVYGVYATVNPGFYRRLSNHGVEVKKYGTLKETLLRNPGRFWTRHLHDKYFVADGKEAILGGMNWSGRYARGGDVEKCGFRDTDIYVKGPQAAIIEKEFLKRWYRDASPELCDQYTLQLDEMYGGLVWPPGRNYADFLVPSDGAPYGVQVTGLTRFVMQEPFEDGEALIAQCYKALIDRAQSHVYWQSVAVHPSKLHLEALANAAARGVDVRLMTNSKHTMGMIAFGAGAYYHITKMGYDDFLKAGVRLFEYGGESPLHAKAFVVDDVVAIIGSYNASYTSERYYTESALVVYDTAVIHDVRESLEHDFARCTEVTAPEPKPERPRERWMKSGVP